MTAPKKFDVGINDYRGIGKWLPQDPNVTREWLDKLIIHVNEKKDGYKVHPVIAEFQQLIENDAILTYLFTTMFTQVPDKEPFDKDPDGKPQVRDYKHMFELFNHVISSAPPWSDAGSLAGLVGLPLTAIMDWPIGTPSGISAFGRPDVNAMIKKMLDVWGEFLKSPESTGVLSSAPDGWLSPHALASLSAKAADGCKPVPFEETYNCDPSAPHYGFTSWDDFFTRTFKEGVRPVASPDDDHVIVNGCESSPYRLATNVTVEANFWIKAQPYSLARMLDRDSRAPEFAGGTVYQAFLSPQSYHRWHAPVSGTIIRTRVIQGTYYMEDFFEGFANPAGPEKFGEALSQGFIASVATRALFLIDADNKDIGLVAFLAVGMVEVSSCEPTVREGDHVKKGDQIGMFHFGGSSHCLIFRPGVELKWVDSVREPFQLETNNIPVRSKLAEVVSGAQ